ASTAFACVLCVKIVIPACDTRHRPPLGVLVTCTSCFLVIESSCRSILKAFFIMQQSSPAAVQVPAEALRLPIDARASVESIAAVATQRSVRDVRSEPLAFAVSCCARRDIQEHGPDCRRDVF